MFFKNQLWCGPRGYQNIYVHYCTIITRSGRSNLAGVPFYSTAVQNIPESIDWFIEGQAFSRSYALHISSPTPTPFSKLYRRHLGRLRKRLADVRTGEGDRGGRGAKSYDSKIAWFLCISFSILSVPNCSFVYVPRTVQLSIHLKGCTVQTHNC